MTDDLKFYIVMTEEGESDTKTGRTIILHKHLYITKEMAFEEAAKHKTGSVIVLTQTDFFDPKEVQDWVVG